MSHFRLQVTLNSLTKLSMAQLTLVEPTHYSMDRLTANNVPPSIGSITSGHPVVEMSPLQLIVTVSQQIGIVIVIAAYPISCLSGTAHLRTKIPISEASTKNLRRDEARRARTDTVVHHLEDILKHAWDGSGECKV